MAEYYYSSVVNVRKIMRKLPSSITDEDILYRIKQADALINAKLGGVFELPFLQTPPMIEMISTDLAIFFLMESLYSSQQPNLDEYQIKRYERAMGWLDDIVASEKSRLGNDSGFDTTTEGDSIFTLDSPYW